MDLENFDRTVAFFTDLGIPLPELNAAFVARLEYYGGMLLILGLGTRLVAGLLSTTMVVALLTADRETFVSALLGRGEAGPTDVTAFVFLLFLVWVGAYGPGWLSLDHPIARRLGIDVSVILPAYRTLSLDRSWLRRTDWQLRVPVSDRRVTAGVLTAETADHVPVYLIEADQYFARNGLYGTPDGDFPDTAERSAFFARAIPALLPFLDSVDVLPCHDFHALSSFVCVVFPC